MSNKSGTTSSAVISLPKGGGALHGIGEKFSPDLHTGTGNFTVPIALPPGRNGLEPQLELAYSTGSGNGPFGLGWSLSVPGVSRQTSQGIPRYSDAQDIFILSGAEDLVSIEQQPGETRYRPRTEGLFARIEHHHDDKNDFWQVWSKEGLISFYGTPRPTDAGADWFDPAVVADPVKRGKIFAWKLTHTQDPFGNRIEYDYARDATAMTDPTTGIRCTSHRSAMSTTPIKVGPSFSFRSPFSIKIAQMPSLSIALVLKSAPGSAVSGWKFVPMPKKNA